MKLIFNLIKRYKKVLILALVLASVNQFFLLLDPQIFRLIIDRYVSQVGQMPVRDFVSGVVLLLLASVVVAFISRVAKNFQDYYVSVITQRVGASLYARGVEHSFSLPYAVFEDQRSGELLGKLQKARADSENFIRSMISTVFLSLIGIIFVIAYAVYVHWSIGSAYAMMIPALGTATYLIGRKIKALQQEIVLETANLAGSTTETLRNVELVKSLGLEDQEVWRLNAVNEKILGLELKKVRLIRRLSFTQGTIINTLRSGLLLLMLWLIATAGITVGEFFSLFIYSFFIFNPLSELGTVFSYYQESRGSAEELQKILQTPSETKPSSPAPVAALQTVDFQNVGFSYQDSNKTSIRNLNLKISAGQTLAFVGPSGAGKTTIVKLLVGLYKPQTGRLLFNGVPSERVDFNELRKKVGLVMQETQLFAGTVRENLKFIRPQATDEECWQVLQAAAATSILERGGKGLDTRIGEGGLKISGGERQRLAIARALLRQPEMLIFDEATSSLDSLTEKEISKTINEISATERNRIIILIAHRLSTIIQADVIYVLEKGRIIESGRHEKLLLKKGLYAALWREQIASYNNNL